MENQNTINEELTFNGKKRLFSEKFFLSAGESNADKEMAQTILTAKLIDIATAHANHWDIGNMDMIDPNCGWVLSRLTIEMHSYPKVNEDYTIETWAVKWNRHFSERDYCIKDDSGSILGYARSIWMILDLRTHSNFNLDTLPFRKEYLLDRECPIAAQAKHRLLVLPEEEEAKSPRAVTAEKVGSYRFQYCDLDFYRHVNTVRYVALLMNRYSLRQHDEMRVRRFELSFLSEGAYDMEVDILKAPIDDTPGADAFMLRDSATRRPVLYSRIFLTPR